jgi:hypothetical protein
MNATKELLYQRRSRHSDAQCTRSAISSIGKHRKTGSRRSVGEA